MRRRRGQESGGQGGAVIFKTALGDKASGEKLLPLAFSPLGLRLRWRTCGSSCGHVEVQVGPGPLRQRDREHRVNMVVASKPAKEFEEEDTEGVDLYKGSFSLAYGTLTLLRTKMHLERNRFWVCGGRTGAVRLCCCVRRERAA